jgi:hypothetical protein
MRAVPVHTDAANAPRTGFGASDNKIYVSDEKLVEAPNAEPRDLYQRVAERVLLERAVR